MKMNNRKTLPGKKKQSTFFKIRQQWQEKNSLNGTTQNCQSIAWAHFEPILFSSRAIVRTPSRLAVMMVFKVDFGRWTRKLKHFSGNGDELRPLGWWSLMNFVPRNEAGNLLLEDGLDENWIGF